MREFEAEMNGLIMKETEKFEPLIDLRPEFKIIAFTSTLRENLFILFISLLSKVPSILVGPPGSSKTLCTRMLY